MFNFNLSLHANGSGLNPQLPSPELEHDAPQTLITDEAAVRLATGSAPMDTPRIVMQVAEDECVAQGAPLAHLSNAPTVQLVAPMPARVARIALLPGKRLHEIVLYREAGNDVVEHSVNDVATDSALRVLLQKAGIWPWLRRRPFGGMPAPDERPAAILVMAHDTRPFAPDPLVALEGRETGFTQGLIALTRLTDGPVLLCVRRGASLVNSPHARVRIVHSGARHPQGSPGIRVHALAPATLEAPVWDLHAEDVATIGELLECGTVAMTRLVSVAGSALRTRRLVHTQPGADLRALTQRSLLPGAHQLLSGSPLEGHMAHWLAPRDRQVSALSLNTQKKSPHWLFSALTNTGRARPVIPSAALSQAFGAALPAMPFVRALSAGDDESALELGLLSLLEEDMALADYVLGGDTQLAARLRSTLERVRETFVS